MAAPTEAQIAHQELMDELDIHSIHKSFRSSGWKPNQRRNKNIKTILGDASRREATSIVATPQDNNSGAASPGGDDNGLSTSGTSTPTAATTAASGSGNGSGSGAPPTRRQSKSETRQRLKTGAQICRELQFNAKRRGQCSSGSRATR